MFLQISSPEQFNICDYGRWAVELFFTGKDRKSGPLRAGDNLPRKLQPFSGKNWSFSVPRSLIAVLSSLLVSRFCAKGFKRQVGERVLCSSGSLPSSQNLLLAASERDQHWRHLSQQWNLHYHNLADRSRIGGSRGWVWGWGHSLCRGRGRGREELILLTRNKNIVSNE